MTSEFKHLPLRLGAARLAVACLAICAGAAMAAPLADAYGPAVALPGSELAPICRTSGNRIAVVYSHRAGDTTPTPTAQLRSIVQRMNWKISDQSSQSSGGKRILRMPVDCNAEGQINVYNLTTANNYFETLRTGTRNILGAPSGESAIKYLDFDHSSNEENPNVFGRSDFEVDATKGHSNKNALNTGTAAIYSGVWENHVTIHELFHTMGAAQSGAPDADGKGHVTDGWDIMASNLAEYPCLASLGFNQPTTVPLDCDRDTYFNAAPSGGSWLATHWDVAGRENWFLVAAPKATTGATDWVKGKSAVLTGVADPEGTKTSYYFEYGKTTSYGAKTASITSNEGPVSFSSTASGLEIGTLYHYRVVATNIDGATAKGEDKTFTTLTPPKPVLTLESPSGLGEAGATLNGTVNPNDTDTIYWFEYGKTTSYNRSSPAWDSEPDPWEEALWAEKLLEGTEGVKVSEAIKGLEPALTYHFRLVAENEGGVTYGNDQTFTTPGVGKTPAPTFAFAIGREGTGAGQFDTPEGGITFDSAGHFWVGDKHNNRLVKFNSKGQYLTSFGSYGTGAGQFNHPVDIAIDVAGNLWVADQLNHRVEKFNSKGQYLTSFGSYGTGAGQFNQPNGIAIDAAGNIWVTDVFNSRVQKFDSTGKYLSQFGKKGSGNGEFDTPTDIVVDGTGNLWVVDAGNDRVQKFDSEGKYLSQFGKEGSANGQLQTPRALAIGPEGNFWVTDRGNRRVEAFNSKGEYVAKFGSEGTGDGQFGIALGYLAFDADGNLWVGDSGNDRIQKWVFGP